MRYLMSRFRKGWVTLLILILLLPACQPRQVTAACREILVGVMSAPEGTQEAREQQDGYDLAWNEINRAGGAQGCKLKLVASASDISGGNLDKVQADLLNLADQGVVAILGAT